MNLRSNGGGGTTTTTTSCNNDNTNNNSNQCCNDDHKKEKKRRKEYNNGKKSSWCHHRRLTWSERMRYVCLIGKTATKLSWIVRIVSLLAAFWSWHQAIGFLNTLSFSSSDTVVTMHHRHHDKVLFDNRMVLSPPELLSSVLLLHGGRSKSSLLESVFLPVRSRVVGHYYLDATSHGFLGTERLVPDLVRPLTGRTAAELSKKEIKAQLRLRNSRDYRHDKADPVEQGGCVPQHDWQTSFYPSCNAVHETAGDLHRQDDAALLASGYFRDVWVVGDTTTTTTNSNDAAFLALKTLRYTHDYSERNVDRHRRDAVAMERLSSSPNVLDIYAFCGQSGLFEFAPNGDLQTAIERGEAERWTSQQILQVSYYVAKSLSDLHGIPTTTADNNHNNNHNEQRRRPGLPTTPSIAHTDVALGQFVRVGDELRYKLNDFNRARFLLWDPQSKENCCFFVSNNAGTFRAPEEYAYGEEDEKVDVFSMGNVFYSILHGHRPFAEIHKAKTAIRYIEEGKRAPIKEELRNSNDPYTKAMLQAISLCWVQDPNKRASAAEVVAVLQDALEKQPPPPQGQPQQLHGGGGGGGHKNQVQKTFSARDMVGYSAVDEFETEGKQHNDDDRDNLKRRFQKILSAGDATRNNNKKDEFKTNTQQHDDDNDNDDDPHDEQQRIENNILATKRRRDTTTRNNNNKTAQDDDKNKKTKQKQHWPQRDVKKRIKVLKAKNKKKKHKK